MVSSGNDTFELGNSYNNSELETQFNSFVFVNQSTRKKVNGNLRVEKEV